MKNKLSSRKFWLTSGGSMVILSTCLSLGADPTLVAAMVTGLIVVYIVMQGIIDYKKK